MAEPVTTSLAQPVATQGCGWGRHGTWRWRGLACHWRVLGEESRPAVLLIHGFGAASGHWRFTAAPLVAAGWCVYAIDLIGFGASDQPGLRLDNRFWARQCGAFLEQVVGRPAVLVGNSLGSLVAVTTAVFTPSWVRAVAVAPLPDPTLLMPIPRRRPPWRRRLRQALAVLLCTALPLELLLPLIARTVLLDLALAAAYPDRRAINDDLRRLIARPAQRPTAAWALRGMSIAMALRPRGATAAPLLERMVQPLLVLWGQKDQLVPVAVAHRLVSHKPDLELQVLNGLGHCPHDEAPERFNPPLLGWLERQKQPANT
ncbi:alpha/beta fold hydrolase [Cyanobium sp. Morenito 9A2]|uniref:alpha/beta fold hydrolase n=1 Tax=Cyanobium sp. Morenito 9A2 TaxID=2823718 RepID=UPI0020CF34C4|nr:alpha/beta fold hydrolase [Cyanobium sp. Morenito 9A2]MCP9849742.1 alpha/beta fold hydrolase [Cyanobium sp. Morenito 9A2]